MLKDILKMCMPSMKEEEVQKVKNEGEFGNMILEVTKFNEKLMRDNKYKVGDCVAYNDYSNIEVIKEENHLIIDNMVYGHIKEVHKTTPTLGLFEWYYTIELEDGSVYSNIMESNLLPIHYIRTSNKRE